MTDNWLIEYQKFKKSSIDHSTFHFIPPGTAFLKAMSDA